MTTEDEPRVGETFKTDLMADPMCNPGLILELIPKVIAQLGAVPETGLHDYPRFPYRQISDLKSAIGPLCGELGITPQFRDIVIVESETRQTSAGAQERYRVVRAIVRFWAPDASWIDQVVYGEVAEAESSDKLWSKIHTAITKNALENCFLPGTASGADAVARTAALDQGPSDYALDLKERIEKCDNHDTLNGIPLNLQDKREAEWVVNLIDKRRARLLVTDVEACSTKEELDALGASARLLKATKNISWVERAILDRHKAIRDAATAASDE